MPEDHRVEGKQPRQPHPTQGRHESSYHGVAHPDLGIRDKVIEKTKGDEEDGEGHRPPPGVEDVDVFPTEVEDRLDALQDLLTEPVQKNNHKDDGQDDNHPDEGDHPIADRVLVTGDPIGQVDTALEGGDALAGRPEGNQGPSGQQPPAPPLEEVIDQRLEEGIDRIRYRRLKITQDRLGIEPHHR